MIRQGDSGVSTYRAALGARGEDIAARLLETAGYTVMARNYHCRYGELDLICQHGAAIVFCKPLPKLFHLPCRDRLSRR